MAASPMRKIDPKLVVLDFRAGGNRLYATLRHETVLFADAPREFLGFARLRMSGYVSQGLFTEFELYEQRLQQVWERMRVIKSKAPVSFVIAAGTSITSGFQLSLNRSLKDCLALLTITAPPSQTRTWHPQAFELSVKRALAKLGVKAAVNDAAVRHAYTLHAGFAYPLRDYQLPPAAVVNPLNIGQAYVVRSDYERLMIEVQVRIPGALRTRQQLLDVSSKIGDALVALTGSPGATPFYRFYRKGLVSGVRAALAGPQGVQLELPATILAASVVPALMPRASEASADRNPPNLASLEAMLAWQMVRYAGAPVPPEQLTSKLCSLHMEGSVQDAVKALGRTGLLCLSAPPRVLTATSGIHVQPVMACGQVPTQYIMTSMRVVADACRGIPAAQRDIEGITVGLSRDTVAEVRALLLDLSHWLNKLGSGHGRGERRICQVNWQLFPLTKQIGLEAVPVPTAAIATMSGGDKRTLPLIIREMAALPSFQADPAGLAKKLYLPVTAAEAQASLKSLEALNEIHFSKTKARYVKTAQAPGSTAMVDGLSLVDYHQDMLTYAQAAVFYAKPEQRDIVGATVAIPLLEERALRDRLLQTLRIVYELAAQEQHADLLYQMNLQYFPLTSS